MNITPQEIEYEEALLGACMLDKDAFERVSSILCADNFYKPEHQEIFKAFERLSFENKNIDLLTVGSIFKDMLALARITSRVSSSANIELYAATVYEKYIAREIISACQMGLSRVYEAPDIFDLQAQILGRLENKINLKSKDPQKFLTIVHETIEKIETIAASDKHITGIDTGLRDLNEISNGWHAPDLVIIAARPATGKTAFALNIALNVVRQNIPVAFFSLEMSGMQLAYRAISIMSGVYSSYLKKANLNDGNWTDIMAVNYDLPLFIDDTAGINLLDFKDKCRKLHRKHGIKIIIVDYLQLMNANVKGSREQEISTISRTLKHIAKELNITVIALAQLSRDVEKRGGIPRLSDLRESGAIEQDADNVLFLHTDSDTNDLNTQIEVIFSKHRNGETGKIILNFDKGKQLFTNL